MRALIPMLRTKSSLYEKPEMIVTKVDKSSKYVGLFASNLLAHASIQNFRIDAVSLLTKKQMISVNSREKNAVNTKA